MSNSIIYKFKQDIEKASTDPHDIESAYDEVFDQYTNQYPRLAPDFQKAFDEMSEEAEKNL